MFNDLTLRDGSHAISHQLTEDDIIDYCKFAEDTGIEVIEVGHGNGLGASSILIGESKLSDYEMLTLARKNLSNTKLSVHIIPGIATISKDIDMAIERGADIFRVASHCTEASLTKTHIEYLSKKNKTVYGVLMMCATCSSQRLVEEALKLKSYGALAIIIMDSSGSFMPSDVKERITYLVKETSLPIGFHGHNNLHMAVSNSIAAIENGASIIDVTMRGFGAGAGNTPLEIMTTLYPASTIDNIKILKKCESFQYSYPICKSVNILTAVHKMMSGFEKHIYKAAHQYSVSVIELINKLAQKKLTAGQEDFIYITAKALQSQKN
jgi:4-hydroxy 2-oxovalerate aldolase